MFHNIRIDVMDKTNGDQVPWTEDGIERRERPVFAHMPPDRDGLTTADEAERAWADAKNTNSPAVLESFIKRYGDSFQGDLARARLEELKKSRVAAVQPPVAARRPLKMIAVGAPPAAVESSPCGDAPVIVFLSSRPACPLSASEERALKPKDTFKECEKCPEMIVVPAGSFTMGSPSNEPGREDGESQVRVTIAKPFAAGRFAVTFDEWDQCVADGDCEGYRPSDEGFGRGRRPVINVAWDDAQKYVAWLSSKTGRTYRLLSEAEREYVTRAGTTTPFWWGNSISPTQANYNGDVDPYKGGGIKDQYLKQTVPVDSFEPNPWGLYNVHGNVWDWTQDRWNDSNSGNPGDGSARTRDDCRYRVLRGGAWYSSPAQLRAASRTIDYDGSRGDIGFRVARTLSP
jgi:formylglycine-generating enzyme required for sulfatase activity